MNDIEIESDLQKYLRFSDSPISTIKIVELLPNYRINNEGTEKTLNSRTALYIENDNSLLYFVIEFYKKGGVKRIYLQRLINVNHIKREIITIGKTYIDTIQIQELGTNLIRRYSVEDFFSSIETIFSIWLRLSTKKNIKTIPEYEYTSENINPNIFYFGVAIVAENDTRKSNNINREREMSIKKEFLHILPRFKSDEPLDICVLI